MLEPASVFFYVIGLWWWPALYVGLAAQSADLLSRGFHLGRLPLVGLHDTLIFLTASIVAFSVPFYKLISEKRLFRLMLAGTAVVITFAAVFSPPHEVPLPALLSTYYFEFHVALSFFSYALFGIGAFLGVLYLAQPDPVIEKRQYKAILFGYVLFSVSMIIGGIWAYYAWATYWLWTPKELWTSILWLYYGFYLHARFRPFWYGRKAAWTGAIGFVIVLFTYVGVGLLMKSSHSF